MAAESSIDSVLESTVASRFTSQTSATQDTNPVGLLDLEDFRKKQTDANGQKGTNSSGVTTPNDSGLKANQTIIKKRRKQVGKGKLSFGDDEEEDTQLPTKKPKATLISHDDVAEPSLRKRLGANASIAAPRIMTKSSQLRETERKERLRKEFLAMQEAVKATEFGIPFVFFDGTNNPGGQCRMKKGEHVWIFLDRCRKIGAELGISGGLGAGTRREWARVSVDDLMLVRGEVIIPHHYDFYYFIVNKSKGYDGRVLFPYSSEIIKPQESAAAEVDLSTYNPLTAYKSSAPSVTTNIEGSTADPTFTKVIDRRWYERNKHIYPASSWVVFDAEKDYTNSIRRDPGGNAYFFS